MEAPQPNSTAGALITVTLYISANIFEWLNQDTAAKLAAVFTILAGISTILLNIYRFYKTKTNKTNGNRIPE